jgi:O-antigen/teichoic acid export membrane protein
MELQLRSIQIARSAILNWATTASMIVASYFMAPFLIHRLGNLEYGVWVLALSTTGYLYLLDLGLRSSILRFVSRAHSLANHEQASQVVSAVLWVRLQIGAFTLLVATIIGVFFPRLFQLPEALRSSSREALFVIGLTIALNMPMSAIGAVLSALNRYDLQSYISLLQLLIRVGGIVLVVRQGKGIVAIAICEFLAALAGNILTYAITRNIYPELRLSLQVPSRLVLRPLWSYGAYAFILLVSLQLTYQADNVIVGLFVSAAGVTLYSIGNSLSRSTQQLFGAVTNTFVSAASVYEASGSQAKLRSLYLNGTRAILILCLPLLITLIIRARSFIALWIGPQYSGASATVTSVLALALMLSLFNTTAGSIAIGIDRHKAVAIWTICEVASNLILSIALGRAMGLVGVAIGTLAPSMIVNLILWPRYIPRMLDVQRSEILTKIAIPIGLSAAPFTLGSVLINRYSRPRSMGEFLYQTLLLLATFYVVILAAYWSRLRRDFFPWLMQTISSRGEQISS